MAQSGAENGYINVSDEKIGLDRANVLPDGRIMLPEDDNKDITQGLHIEKTDTEQSKRERLREKRDHAKDKLKKALHIQKDHGEPVEQTEAVLAKPVNEPSDARLVRELPKSDKNAFKDFVHNPVETVKDKVSGQGNHQAAANIVAKEIPHGEEVDLVRAHDRVDDAQSETERLLAMADLEKLVKQRQDMYVRWTMDRHVTKVRRLPREDFPKKNPQDFEKIDPIEGRVMDWRGYLQHLLQYYSQQYGGQYIGYGSDPPAPSKKSIMPNIERLLIASSPVQEFIMTTRRVYRWEVPSETANYLVIYMTLWYFNLLLPGGLSFLIYLVAERRFRGRTIEQLRQDIKRTEDRSKTALSINELIEKRGDDHWADELLEGLGPWLMVQLADAANALEVIRNFYEWRKPYRTGATLAILVLAVVATTVTPLWLLVKVSTFAMGFAFFALWPVAVNFPEYRLLVSPIKRLFWNIPTHAEWSLKAIQAKGARYEQEHPNPCDADLGTYKAHFQKTTGHIILSPTSIRFVSNATSTVEFVVNYSQIDRLEKVERMVSKKLPKPEPIKDSGRDLKLVGRDGRAWLVNNVDKRDEVFSQIIGFSHTDWQVVW